MGAKASTFGPVIEPQVFQPEIPRQNLGRINAANAKDTPLYLVFDVNLAAVGNSVTCFCESEIPDYWLVSMVSLTGLRALCFAGPNSSGIPIRLGGGGFAKIPGLNEYFTVVNIGGVVQGTVVAVRKYQDLLISGGSLV